VVPGWLHRAAAISWRLLAIAGLAAVLVWLAFLLGTVTASVLLALIVAATFAPLVRRLRARGWSRTRAAASVTAAALLVGVGALLLLTLAFLPDLAAMVGSMQAGLAELRDAFAAASIPSDVAAEVEQAAEGLRAWVGEEFSALASAVASVVTVAILALFLTFFVLQDGEKAWAWLLQAATDRKRERIETSGRDALERVGGYLRGTAMLSAVLASAYAVFLWILGVPVVAPLAVLVFLGGFIPYLGGLLAMSVTLLVALSTVGPESTLILLVLMVVANILAANLIRPAVYGRSVRLHPAVVLVALPTGAAIAGIVGVFAAIPVTAFVVAIGGAIIDALEPETAAEQRREVSGWVDRLAQWSWRLLAVVGVLAVVLFLVGQAPLVVIPVVLATVIAATVAPLARVLRARGWREGRAALTVTGGAYLLILGIVVIAAAQLAAPLASAVNSSIDGAEQLGDDAGGTLGWVESVASTFGGNLLDAVNEVLRAIAAAGVVLVLAALLSFYFLRDGPAGWDVVLKRASAWRREELMGAGHRAVGILGGYMFGTAAISAVGAISQFLIMVILGLPFAIPIAILSFIAAFIPYIGGFITTGLAFLVAVAFGTPTQIAIMFVYTIVFNIVQGNVVTPMVYNRAVNLHPAVVLLAIPAGGAVAGIAGMFLVVPFLAVVAASWRTVLRVLGDEPPAPVPTPEAPPAVEPPVPIIEGSVPSSAD
jgi:putative heme transporter